MERPKVKVVKRSDAKPGAAKKVKSPSPRAAAREIVSTVSDWVSDFKQRKTEETKYALETLLSTNRQPRES